MQGGLVHMRHDDIKGALADACGDALRPTAVREEPLIEPRTCRPVPVAPASPAREPPAIPPALLPAPVPQDDPAAMEDAVSLPGMLENLASTLAPGDPAPIDTDAEPTVEAPSGEPAATPIGESEPHLPTPNDEPTIYNAQVSASQPVVQLNRVNPDQHEHGLKRGDLLVHGFFKRSTDVIVDIKVINLQSRSYRGVSAATALKNAEKFKKRKYAKLCARQRRTFVPFVISCCGVLGPEAQTFLQRLAQLYSDKYDQPYSRSRAYLNKLVDVALVRSCNHCIRGSRVHRKHMSTARQTFFEKPSLEPPADFLFA